MRLQAVDVKQEYIRFFGGLDLNSPAISIPPGAAITAQNYEPGALGGFRRIDGYERFNGKTSPSAGTYRYCTVNLTGAVVAGNTINGATSGATAVVVVVGVGELAVTKITGTFVALETIRIGVVTVGTLTTTPSLRGYPTGAADAIAMNLVADSYRADIAAPVGSGPVRGLAILRGVLYCFINNAGGTAGLIYKSSSTGWLPITLYKTISFTAGNLAIVDGTTITQAVSGATAIVKRQVLETGTYAGSTATGRFIIDAVTGTFDTINAIQTAAVTRATASSLVTPISILPSGRYSSVEYNFSGSTDTIRLYGCDGVNKAFEFDGDVYIPINTGMALDKPLHIRAHKKMLHLAFRASLQSSGINFPFQWTVVTGASEIGMGEDISGMLTQPGDVLAIATRNSTSQLQGSSIANFVLASLAPEVGAIPYTMQNMGVAYWLDDRGIIQISRTQSYGNFDNATVSRKVQPLIDLMRTVVVASSVYKSRNQVRMYGSDGSGLIMTMVDGPQGMEHHFTSFTYPVNVSCAVSGEDANGKDVVFFGSSTGGVFQADKGSSFDGEDIEAFIRLPFNHSKSPSTLKQYRKAVVEMTAVSYSEIRLHPDFSYGDPNISQHRTQNSAVQSAGGVYDVSFYESCYHDARVVSSPEIKINGTGTNVGFVFYSKTDMDLGHILQGVTIHFTPRRLQR